MIIITKEASKINSVFNGLSSIESADEIQKEAQRLYVRDCFLLEKNIVTQGGTYPFARSNVILQQSISMILSSNRRKFVIGGTYNVLLRLYQLRSKDKMLSEDILAEPLYPGFQIPITDIYEVLKSKPHCHSAHSYLLSTIPPRNRQRIRERFRAILPQCFTGGVLSLNSFEEFLCLIHQLDAASLQLLFKCNITFFEIQ